MWRERFLSVIIEHFAGEFPLWLSPVQVKVLPIAETHNEYAEAVVESLRKSGIRVEIDDSNESFGKKVRNAKVEKVPYFVVIGDEEVKAMKVTLEGREEKETLDLPNLLEKLQQEGRSKLG